MMLKIVATIVGLWLFSVVAGGIQQVVLPASPDLGDQCSVTVSGSGMAGLTCEE